MPGIVGLIGPGAAHADAAARVTRMVDSMRHEDFYRTGTLSEPALGVQAGWVNRANSFADCLPAWNERRDLCLLFTGENFQSDASGDALAGNDARSLLELHDRDPARFFERLNGWFSGLLLDLRARTVTLFNDRFGLSRVYLHETSDGLYFASEAKALLAVLPQTRGLSQASLAAWFSYGAPLNDQSLFQGVTLLPGAARWTFSPGQPARRESYFRQASWTEQAPLSVSEYPEALEQTFRRVLPRYFQGREKVGVSLTGGVDSRMIMALANLAPGSTPCYTFGGMYRDCTDVLLAREIARQSGQTHQTLEVGNEFLRQFSELAPRTVYLTDGAMDVSASPDLFTNRIARGIAPVRLTGNYGGEILRSIVAFRPRPIMPGLLANDFLPQVRAADQVYAQQRAVPDLPFVAFKQVPWHHHSRLSLELSQLTLRSPYLDNDLVGLSFRVPRELATSNELALRLIERGSPALAKLGTDRGVLLRAVPLVTPARNFYGEFTFKAEYAYDYGMPQWLTRLDNRFRALHLERLFLGRHKFYHFRYWYRHALAKYIAEVLLDPRSLARPYLEGRKVERMVKEHTTGQGNYTLEIHKLLSMELLQRQLIEAH